MKISELKTAVARAANALGVTDAQLIVEFMDDAQDVLRREYDWPFFQKKSTITLVAGTAEYALPTDFDTLVAAYYTDSGGVVTFLDPTRDARRIYVGVANEADYSNPREYTLTGSNKIQLAPIPSADHIANYGATLYLEYWSTPARISTLEETEEPAWPTDFHSILKWGTVLLMASIQGDSALQQSAGAIYENFKRKQEVKYRLRYREPYKPILACGGPTPGPRRYINDYGRKR